MRGEGQKESTQAHDSIGGSVFTVIGPEMGVAKLTAQFGIVR